MFQTEVTEVTEEREGRAELEETEVGVETQELTEAMLAKEERAGRWSEIFQVFD